MALSTKAVIAIAAALVLSMLTIVLSVGLTVGFLPPDTIYVSTVETVSTSTGKSSSVTTVATTTIE